MWSKIAKIYLTLILIMVDWAGGKKKEVYEHRKLLIDGLFGAENVVNYANTIKLILKNDYKISDFIVENTSIEQSHNQNLKKCKKLV